MIFDVIFNFRMSSCLLNTECFIFPGISDDKGLATMFGLKIILQSEIYNHHFYIYDMFWNTYEIDTISPAQANYGFHFHLVCMHGLRYTFILIIFVLILVHSNPYETEFMRQATNLKLTKMAWCLVLRKGPSIKVCLKNLPLQFADDIV